MKILVTGAMGQLGKETVRLMEREKIPCVGLSRADLDIRDLTALGRIIENFQPTHLINCSAYNAVDKAETQRDEAMSVNGTGPGEMALLCGSMNCRFIHFSTDFVFNGSKTHGLYTEDDTPDPISFYGVTKLKGEQTVLAASSDNLVLRVSWVFGPGKVNFPAKVLEWAAGSGPMRIADDETSVPTWTGYIALRTLAAMKADLTGLYHAVAGGGATTRHDYALKVLELAGLNPSVERVSRHVFQLPAERPQFSAMSGDLLASELNMPCENWNQHLVEYARETGWSK
ncbi:MAG: dTDP-4-dehydrorhamnose reductase [Candidatus Wallbacteria bacterium HGW-Wallbacteria-1]|jgi:dTDP-4-dehydrorhamnose reductase|uniref:dTDP-4-dehydrorhamnose reductase n=1 Tax=Candidatus Wallbacteria bacterium HGW-Wallbacteria-1 TaxID=2013854 RepID=A0A2N1PML7_9BACT|nr:MAG: dTDP-4-dehydrorhamnose reductase [Candidatus Wallbacteria bacterium HGW-Wallbacteria-1]